MEIYPIEVKRTPEGLAIKWSDGRLAEISAASLRRYCPCAGCRKEESALAKPQAEVNAPKSLRVVAHTVDEQTNLVRVWGVGNYAIGIEWGDGHNTGIYTFDLLRKLSGID